MKRKNAVATVMQAKNYNATIGDRIISNMSFEETLESARQLVKAYEVGKFVTVVVRELNFCSHIIARLCDGTIVNYDVTSDKEQKFFEKLGEDMMLIMWDQLSRDTWWICKKSDEEDITYPVDVTRNVVLDNPMPAWKKTILDRRIIDAVSEAGFICEINRKDEFDFQIAVIDGDCTIGFIEFKSLCSTDNEVNLVPIKLMTEAPDRCSDFEWATLRDYLDDKIVKIADELDK